MLTYLPENISEERVVDAELDRKVDIGYPKLRVSRSSLLQDRISQIKAQRTNPDLEKLARLRKCKIKCVTIFIC